MSATTLAPQSFEAEPREQDGQVAPSPPQVYGYSDPPLPFGLGSVVSDVTHHLDFHLVAPLGNGSYAIVYLVQEVQTGKLFALKCLSKKSLTEEQLDVQANEMTIHRSLPKNPRIVQFHNSFETSEWLFLLLEYIEGTDLYWWITQKSDQYDLTGHKLKERERLDIVRCVFKQCLEAVGAVHEAGIAHRDLKPENFLITKDHQVKLSDFGLSTNEKYSTDFDCGSKPYMSYECRNPITPTYNPIPADIWSLGIIFLNLIWHRSPWSDPDPHSCAAFAAFQNDKIGFLLQRFEGMPESVAKFLAHRVFCPAEEGRVKIKEWKKWCDKLVELMDVDDSTKEGVSVSDMIVPRTGTDKDQITAPPTKRRTLGFSPLSLTMSALKSSKSRESTISPKPKKTSLFPIVSPTAISPSSSLDQRLASTTPVGSPYPGSFLDGGKASWSEAFDFDASGEMDFSQPIVFDDGVSIRARSDSTDSKLSDKRISVGGEHDEDEVRSDNDSGFATDEMEEAPKLDDASADVFVSAVDDANVVATSTQAPVAEKENETILLAPPSLPHAASRPASPVQIVAESSVPKPVASLSAKPPSRILKYIPPKITSFSRQHDKSHHQSSTHLPPLSPAILIPSARTDRRNPHTAPSFEDSSAAMASSFGGHGINVGGYAYQRRPFAPPPPAWRADKSNYNSFGKRRGAREYGNDGNGKRGGRNSGAYGNDGNNYSYARSGRSNESNPWGNELSSSPQAYRGKKSSEYQRPSSYERHQGGSQRDYFVPQRQDNSNRNSKQRKRSSTISSSSTVFQMDSVSVFNKPMPGMTTYQSLKGRTTTTGFATSPASGNTLAVPATPASFASRNSIFAGSNATSLSLNIIPPTPTDESRADPIATAAPFSLKTRKSSPALTMPRTSMPRTSALAPLDRVDNRYAEMQEKDVVFGEGYDDDEVTLNGGDAAASGTNVKSIGWEDEQISGEGEDEHGEDGKLKVLGKSTMVEFTRLLRGIVGYNRSVKVGGEGKDVKV